MKKLLIQILITCFFAVVAFAKSNIEILKMSDAKTEILFGSEYESLYVDAGTITSSGRLDAIWQVLQGKKWVYIPTQEIENSWEEYEAEDGYPNRSLQSIFRINTKKYPSGGKFRCIIWDIENPEDKITSKTINLSIIKKNILLDKEDNITKAIAIKGIDQTLSVYGQATCTIYYAWKKLVGKKWEYIARQTGDEKIGDTHQYFRIDMPLDPNRTYKNEKFICEIWCNGQDGQIIERVESKPITVNTKPKPEIIINKKITKTEAFDGTDSSVKLQDAMATFSVNVKNSVGKAEYAWIRNGYTIRNAESNTYKTNRLIASNGDFNDEYEVFVYFRNIQTGTGAYGETINFGKIQKLEPAKVESISPKGQVAVEGEGITISVNTTKESGSKLKYAWQVCAASADENNPKSWKNTGKNSSELTIKKVSANMNRNKYRCKVSNAGNTKNPSISEISIVEVQAPAAIKKLSLPKTMIEGTKSPKIAVELSKGRNVKYTYSYIDKAGTEVVLAKDTTDTQIKLESLPSGTFTIKCVAQSYDDNGNPFGKPVEKTGKVTIREKISNVSLSVSQIDNLEMEITSNENEYEAFFNNKLTLSAKANGYSPSYQWYSSKTGYYGDWERIPGATKKDYCPSMKKIDWSDCLVDEDGIPYKFFKCMANNRTNGWVGYSVDSPVVKIYATEPLIGDFSDRCFSIPYFMNEPYGESGVIVKNSKEMLIFGDFYDTKKDRYFSLTDCKYTLNLTSKESANIIISATKVYNKENHNQSTEKVTYKGTLKYVDYEDIADNGYLYDISYELTLNLGGETITIPLQENTPENLSFEDIVTFGVPISFKGDVSQDLGHGIVFNDKKRCTYIEDQASFSGTYTTKPLGTGIIAVNVSIKGDKERKFPQSNAQIYVYCDKNGDMFIHEKEFFTLEGKKFSSNFFRQIRENDE